MSRGSINTVEDLLNAILPLQDWQDIDRVLNDVKGNLKYAMNLIGIQPNAQDIVMFRLMGHLSYADIAKKLGLSASGVGNSYYKTITILTRRDVVYPILSNGARWFEGHKEDLGKYCPVSYITEYYLYPWYRAFFKRRNIKVLGDLEKYSYSELDDVRTKDSKFARELASAYGLNIRN